MTCVDIHKRHIVCAISTTHCNPFHMHTCTQIAHTYRKYNPFLPCGKGQISHVYSRQTAKRRESVLLKLIYYVFYKKPQTDE